MLIVTYSECKAFDLSKAFDSQHTLTHPQTTSDQHSTHHHQIRSKLHQRQKRIRTTSKRNIQTTAIQGRSPSRRSPIAHTLQHLHLRHSYTFNEYNTHNICRRHEPCRISLQLPKSSRNSTTLPRRNLLLDKRKLPHPKPRQIHCHTSYSRSRKIKQNIKPKNQQHSHSYSQKPQNTRGNTRPETQLC